MLFEARILIRSRWFFHFDWLSISTPKSIPDFWALIVWLPSKVKSLFISAFRFRDNWMS